MDPAHEPALAAHPRDGWRADQPRGVAVVLRSCWRAALPDRRYLVADRNRRHPDHPDPGRHAIEAEISDAAVFRRRTRHRRQRWEAGGWPWRGESLHCAPMAGNDANGLWRPPALCRDLFFGFSRALLYR